VWITLSVKYSQNNNRVTLGKIIDDERKSTHYRTANVLVFPRMRFRISPDGLQAGIHGNNETRSEARNLYLRTTGKLVEIPILLLAGG